MVNVNTYVVKGSVLCVMKMQNILSLLFPDFTSLLPVPMDPLLTTKCTNGRTTKIIFHIRPLMAIHELGIHEWDWVHEWLFMPEGAAQGHKKHSCTQSHSWTPFIHQFMMDHPSYAIILQIHTFNLPKTHEKSPFILPLSTFKSFCKISDLLGMYQTKQGVRCVCTYAWAHNNRYLRRNSNFSA